MASQVVCDSLYCKLTSDPTEIGLQASLMPDAGPAMHLA